MESTYKFGHHHFNDCLNTSILRPHASLKPYNTFGLDVEARWLLTLSGKDDLRELPTVWNDNERKLVLGGGSNVLFTAPFDGLVVLNRMKGLSFEEDEGSVLVHASSGEKWHELVMQCVAKGLGGIENLALIPGTVGAAPIQNIGAYGVELKDVFEELSAIDPETGEQHVFDKDNCMFGYRNSIFKHELKGRMFITSVTLRLKTEHTPSTSYGAIKQVLEENGITEPGIKEVAEAVIAIRRSKLPDPAELGNAGSFFKNPEISLKHFEQLQMEYPDMPGYPLPGDQVKVPAGWLIETCGWKGRRFGHTGAHAKQALVLVNYGGATGTEIAAHALRIIENVKERFQITLQPEVNII